MGLVKYRATTVGKIEITKGEKKEAGLKLHHRIVRFIKKHNIPPQLVINFDQTPSKYVPVGNQAMAECGAGHVFIA